MSCWLEEAQAGIKISGRNISHLRYADDTTLMAESEEGLKSLHEGQEATVRTRRGTSSKLEKEYVKAVYCHPVYLTSMQSTSCEMSGWKKHKLESRLPAKLSTTSDMQIPL